MITREELSSSLREYLAGFLTEDQVNAAIKLFAGDKAMLTTMDRSSLVNAINENKERLDEVDRDLDCKVNISVLDSKVWSLANMGQDVKEAMTGGSVAVVEKDTILTENIVDKQVTRGKTTFYSISKEGNLISNEINVYKYGYLYTDDGSKIYGDHLTCKLTLEDIDFINIPLRFNFTSHITFWDENSSFISGYIQGSLDNGILTEKLKNIPSNAKYVRMLVYNSRIDNAVFSLDEAYMNDLKCVYYIPNFISSDENLNNKQNKNPLFGKKAIFFGDSWCAGNTSAPGGWASIIKSNNPSMTVTNCGRHGADWGQFYSYWFNNVDNYNSLDDDTDYIIIEAYTNGLYTNVSNLTSKPLGNIDSYTYYNSISEIDEALGETYARDLERCLFSVVNRWNGKKIGLMFPYKAVAHLEENNAFRIFRDTVIKCANKYNIPIFDNFNGSNIQCWRQEYVDKYFFESDGTHLNALGYSIITPPIENWIKTL